MPTSIWGDPDIVQDLTSTYSKLASLTTFTQHEIERTFTQEEAERLETLLDEMRKATDDNARKTLLITRIDEFSGVILKIAKKVVV
ncbi:MAG: hypothetical protein AAFY02_16895 [Pseudomonadota bacterium]